MVGAWRSGRRRSGGHMEAGNHEREETSATNNAFIPNVCGWLSRQRPAFRSTFENAARVSGSQKTNDEQDRTRETGEKGRRPQPRHGWGRRSQVGRRGPGWLPGSDLPAQAARYGKTGGDGSMRLP